jgi:glutamate synthase (NADPH) large chain
MTGGIAYVLDENGEFKGRCNKASVDLEPSTIPKTSRRCATGSRGMREANRQPAREMDSGKLADSMLPKFVKVFPHEYKRVLGCEKAWLARVLSPQPPALGNG